MSDSTLTENRLTDIDFIKGVMIFLMVCFHITYVGSLKPEMNCITTFVYSFHMPVFLFYSGFFISTSNLLKVRLKKLVRNILIPYLLFELIYIVSLYLASKFGFTFNNKISVFDYNFVLNKLFIDPIGAYWYLHTLLISIIVLNLVDYFYKGEQIYLIIIIGICYFLLSFIIDGFKFQNSIFIIFGYTFKKYSQKIPLSWLSILPIILIAYFSLPNLERASIYSFGITIFTISFLKYLYLMFSKSQIIKWFTWVGRNTLIIVLIHPIFINIFRLFNKWSLVIDPTAISYLLLTTVATILFSLICSKLFDKLNISRILFGKKIYKCKVN